MFITKPAIAALLAGSATTALLITTPSIGSMVPNSTPVSVAVETDGGASMYRFPDLSKDEIVFAYGNDLWRVPAEGEVAMPGSTGMLPLLVGKPDAPAATLPDPAPDADPETGDDDGAAGNRPIRTAEALPDDAEIIAGTASEKP